MQLHRGSQTIPTRATSSTQARTRGVPLISIITVVLNAVDTLERTILSVLRQDFDDLEYVVIDGGSTDGSLDIIRRYESQIRYWRSKPDNGLYEAMNKGVRASNGRWVLFLGADDLLVNSLRDIASHLTDERTVYYGDVYMPRRRKIYDGPFSAYKLMFHNICQQAIFYPRSVFESYCFDTQYKLWADHAFNIACYGDRRFHFTYIGKLICLYNDYSGATANAEDHKFHADRESLIRAHFSPALFLAYFLRTKASNFRRWCSSLIRRRRTSV
jgi:glycosyltransferase involved in cell wall biosynthesis